MKTLHYSITINAPVQKVWDTMLSEKTYSEWTTVFMPGSHFVGSWDKGSEIRFLAPGENGKSGGMICRVVENKPFEFISLVTIGGVNNDIEDRDSDSVKEWIGGHENYTFKSNGDATELSIDIDTADFLVDDFNIMWPKGLQKLKELSED